MNYTVKWTDDASADFWELWSLPAKRAALTAAAQSVGQLLETNPRQDKYEVVDGFGIAIHHQLGVNFSIDEVHRCVYITAAWLASEDE
jgi:hypothetical protein